LLRCLAELDEALKAGNATNTRMMVRAGLLMYALWHAGKRLLSKFGK